MQSEKRINLKTAQSASNKTFLFFKKRNFKNKVTGETVRTVVARTRFVGGAVKGILRNRDFTARRVKNF
ncbi:MAG: hypothetical protein WKF71_20085 [Pyrinomonadaceae bacterium]